MRICQVAHGFPPELAGGTERSARELALALAAAGHDVSVVAGSIAPAQDGSRARSEASDGPLRVVRLHRGDLHFDHWHKSRSLATAAAFREVLRELWPDVVHVQHWLRLSRDLVLAAAREGVPAVVSLNDHFASCPLVFRVRPDTRAACELPAGPAACVPCAGRVPPRTPWVPREAAWMLLGERQADLLRELRLARARSVPSAAQGRALERHLGLEPGALELDVLPPARAALRGAEAARAARAALEPPAPAGRLVVAAWGEVAPHKGQDLLLDALERAPSRARIELRLAGGEADRGFAASLRARGLPARWLGPYLAEELAGHAVERGAHAFACATRAPESYGLVLDEARELGLPALVPDAGAFAERAVEASGALRFAPGDAGALAALWERLLAEDGLWQRLRAAAESAARAQPAPQDVAAGALALYERAVAAGPPLAPEAEWFEARLDAEATARWDEALAQRSATELGLPEPSP